MKLFLTTNTDIDSSDYGEEHFEVVMRDSELMELTEQEERIELSAASIQIGKKIWSDEDPSFLEYVEVKANYKGFSHDVVAVSLCACLTIEEKSLNRARREDPAVNKEWYAERRQQQRELTFNN